MSQIRGSVFLIFSFLFALVAYEYFLRLIIKLSNSEIAVLISFATFFCSACYLKRIKVADEISRRQAIIISITMVFLMLLILVSPLLGWYHLVIEVSKGKDMFTPPVVMGIAFFAVGLAGLKHG